MKETYYLKHLHVSLFERVIVSIIWSCFQILDVKIIVLKVIQHFKSVFSNLHKRTGIVCRMKYREYTSSPMSFLV